MTIGEINAIKTVERVFPYTTDEKRMKKLSEEVTELSFALASGNHDKIMDEISDVAFVLLHILSRYDDKKEGIIARITQAETKMLQRFQDGYYQKNDQAG